MIQLDIPYKLFANCLPVKGITRSIICDVQRNEIKVIPNDLFQILEKFDGKTIREIQNFHNNAYDDIIVEYFEFLLDNELIFFTEVPEIFPKMDLTWDNPSTITNSIIDLNEFSSYNIFKVLDELNDLNCNALEIRFYNNIGYKQILTYIEYLNATESSIITLEVLISYSKDLKINKVQDLIHKYPRLAGVKIYSSKEKKFIFPVRQDSGYIHYSESKISNNLHCGQISSNFFSVNTKAFTESIKFNSCLNRKISIDVSGNIKNCPSMSQTFGNVNNTTLVDALNMEGFKKYWQINKDQIDVCKDCEFRYICTDCRAFLSNPSNSKSKPLKCGYNPLTNKWENWTANKLSQKPIKFYGLENLD